MASLLLNSSLPESILGNLYNGRENVSLFQKMGNVVLRSLALVRSQSLSLSLRLLSLSRTHARTRARCCYLKFFSLLQDINLNYLLYS